MKKDDYEMLTDVMAVIQTRTLRELVEQVNSSRIQKDDIVSVMKEGDSYFVLYYK